MEVHQGFAKGERKINVQRKTQMAWDCLIVCAVWFIVSSSVLGCASKVQVEKSVVKLLVHKEFESEDPFDCKGTGTIVHINRDRKGYILTNRHVVERLYTGDRIMVQWKDGRSVQAKLYEFDRSLDLAALLTLGALPSDIPQLYFARPKEINKAIREAANVHVYGYPAALDTLALHNGRIQGRSGNTINFKLADDVTLDEGESGSPLLSVQDRIIGIFFGNTEAIHHAIHADIARTVVEGWGIDLNSLPGPRALRQVAGVVSLTVGAASLYGAGDSFQHAKKARDKWNESATYEESRKWDTEFKKKLGYASLYTVGAIAAIIAGYQFMKSGNPPESGGTSPISLNIGNESEWVFVCPL